MDGGEVDGWTEGGAEGGVGIVGSGGMLVIMAVAFARHGQNQKSVCCARGGTARASVEVMLLDLRFAIWREEIQNRNRLLDLAGRNSK